MSKSVQDYKSFAAKINAEKGTIRQNVRLYVPKILSLVLAGILSFFLASASLAQIAIVWDGANQGVNGWSLGGTLTGGGYVSGRAQGVNQGRPGMWQVVGSLGVNGRDVGVEFLEVLDVQGYLTVNTGKTIQEVTAIYVAADLDNYGTLVNGNYGNTYTGLGVIDVAGELYNSNLNTSVGVIRNYESIRAGSITNYGTIETAGNLYIDAAQGIVNGYNSITRNRGDALIRTIEGDAYNSGIFIGVDLTQSYALSSFIKPVASLTQYFDGAIRADYGEIHVSGLLYNAGEISIYPTTSFYHLETEEERWSIYAGILHNDGRLWSQGAAMETMSGLEDAALGTISDARINTTSHLTNQGANAVINASIKPTYIVTSDPTAGTPVNTNFGRSMHVGGDLNNLDRASIFNYREIIVHDNLLNRGATLVGGHWFRHSTFNEIGDLITGGGGEPQLDNEHPLRYQSGLINIGGNVNNISEKAVGGATYGGVIASFDTFQVRGSLYNDPDSLITGSYQHNGTAPGGGGGGVIIVPDPEDPDGPGISVPVQDAIEGRRASVVGGVMLKGEYDDAASQLVVKGLISESEALPTETPFQGLYNAGHIREIDIITVGSDENAVLYNAAPAATPGATLATSNGEARNQNMVNGLATAPAGTITDIGEINATNLVNFGTISDIDAAINVSYSLQNGSTGLLDGLSNSHVRWTYNLADGSPLAREEVLETTRANLSVGELATTIDPITGLATGGLGIVNEGTITNFEHISSLGDMYHGISTTSIPGVGAGNAMISNVTSITVGSSIDDAMRADLYIGAALSNVDSVNVTGDLYLQNGASFANVGTITSNNSISVIGSVNGGFSVLAAKDGALTIGDPLSTTLSPSSLAVTAGSVASGLSITNYGSVVNNGLLSSQTTVENWGIIQNTGTISASSVQNNGELSGNGMVFVNKSNNGTFSNMTDGTIVGGLVVNGNFSNAGGTIRLGTVGDVIRVTNGNAMISGGIVDASAYRNAEVGGQYLFLTTDPTIDSTGQSGPGRLTFSGQELHAGANGTTSGSTGTVLDFAPKHGIWDGTKYVAREIWEKNQHYWLEVQRAYEYGGSGVNANQTAVGEYLDLIGSTVKQDATATSGLSTYSVRDSRNTGLWNLFAQLDGISDDPTNPLYNPDFADHQGTVNPEVRRAIDELSGSIYANLGITSVHNTGVINMTLADALRSDVFKFSFIGNPNNAVRGQAIAPLRYNRWATLLGIAGSSEYDGNTSGYEQSLGGVMAGMDRAFWTGTRLGAFLSVAGGEVSLKELDERTKTVDVMIGMYLRQEMYFGYGLAIGSFGHDTYRTDRNLHSLGHIAESRTHSYIGSMYLERGIDIPVYYATIQPFTSFQAVAVDMDEFTESMRNQFGNSADVGLQGVEGKTSSFKLGLGARASSQPIPLTWGQLALTANMAWYHDFAGKQDRDFIARFTNPSDVNYSSYFNDATFRIYGNDPKQDWFNFGFGLHLDRNSTRFFLNGNLYTNSRQTMFTGNGGIVTSW